MANPAGPPLLPQLPPPQLPPPIPPLARLHVWQIQAVRDLLFVAIVLCLIWVGYAMRAVTVPLLVALALAYLFEPLVARMTANPKTSRPLVVGGLLLAVGLTVVLLLTLLVPLAIGQSVRLADYIRSGRFHGAVLRLEELLPEKSRADFEKAFEWMTPTRAGQASQPQGAWDSLQPGAATEPAGPVNVPVISDEDRVRQIVREELATQAPASPSYSWWDFVRGSGRAVLGLLGTVLELGLLAFLIPFYFFFFSVSYPAVVNFSRDLIPVANRPRALELIAKMDRAVAGFVRGRIVICLLMGLMLAIGWMLVGVPYYFVLGLLVGVFSIVPYLGTIGIPLAVGFLLLEQLPLPPDQRMALWKILVWPTAVFLIVQIIEAYVLTPLIAGKATNLDPVTILVAVLAGGTVGGVYGMILAIPVAACLKILCTDVFLPKVRAWTKGEAEDPLPLGRP